MSASTLDRLRTITHDAGAAAGEAVSDVSGAAIDALSRVDPDRIAAVPGALVGGLGHSSSRTLTLRRFLLGAALIVGIGLVAAVVVRARRGEDPAIESDLETRREARMAG